MTETPAVAFAPERLPGFGEPAPFFRAPTDTNPAFAFESLGGTWIVLMFFGSLGVPAARAPGSAGGPLSVAARSAGSDIRSL